MTGKRIAQTNQQQKSDKPQESGILQRAAVRSVSDAGVQFEEQEALELSNSAFSKDFSQVPISTTQPQQMKTKLKIGQVGDKYEQEADRVASLVVEKINAPASAQSIRMRSVQRQEAAEEDIRALRSISVLQRSPTPNLVQLEALLDEGLQAWSIIQSREAKGGGEASTDVESAINSAKGGGKPLEAGVQRSMGQAMGADFRGVKVHTNAQADQLNKTIQARAFTTGQDIFFRQGEYNPGSRGGQELIAHELTHVVQQKRGESRTPVKGGGPCNQEGREIISNARGVIWIQKKTATEYGESTNEIPAENYLEGITHERVDMKDGDRTAAKGYWIEAGFGSFPGGAVCNHHIPYKEVRNSVRNALLNRSADDVVWRLREVGLPIERYDRGYKRYDIDNAIDALISTLANDKANLFYWPLTSGDDGGKKRDWPVYDMTFSPKQMGVWGSLRQSLVSYAREYDQLIVTLSSDARD